MKKKISMICMLLIMVTCFRGVPVLADTHIIQSSLTLSEYSAVLTFDSNTNEITIDYDVSSTSPADSLGVESIKIYRSNGNYVTTILGTTSNGLIKTSSSMHVGTYSYTLSTVGSFYAEVKVFARIGTDYDSRTITTSTITLP